MISLISTNADNTKSEASDLEAQNMALVAEKWYPALWKRLFLGLLLGAPSPIIFFLQLYALVSALEERKAVDGGVVGDLFIALAVFEVLILIVALSDSILGLFGPPSRPSRSKTVAAGGAFSAAHMSELF